MNMWRKAAEAWDRHLRRGVAGVLATAMAISLLPAASWAAWPIIPPVQITEDTKSQFPNIEFQTNFVRTEYGTLTGLMELAIRVGPSAKDENDKPIPVDFQSIAATLQFNTTLFQPISWRWAYGEMGEAPAPDLKLDAAGYYDVQLPAMKDDTLPGTGAIAQCGVVTGETDMSDNVNSGDQALLFFKAEAYGAKLTIAEMTTLAVIRFYVNPALMDHISIVRDKTSIKPDGSCDYNVFFDAVTQLTDRDELDAAIRLTAGQTLPADAPADAIDPDLTNILPTDFISVGFAIDSDMAGSDSPADMSLHYSAGDNEFYFVPGFDPETSDTVDVPTKVETVTLNIPGPSTDGSMVLAVDPNVTDTTDPARYSYLSNLIPAGNITFPVVSQMSFADHGDGRENMATVLFYDWDDTLIGVLVVPRNDDARALVNDYVRDNMIHPDLRYSEVTVPGKDTSTNQDLVSSLARTNSYRGKYPSTPMGETGVDSTMDSQRTDKLVGSDYPLTNKLDYVFLKRPMERTTNVDGTLTADNTWKQGGDETAAEWDYEYPYIYGWALIPDENLTDIQYTHPENIWTTIGVGELETYTGLEVGAYHADPVTGVITVNPGASELTATDDNFELANFDFRRNPQPKGTVYAVKAVYEPGAELLNASYSYTMVSEPFYNKMNYPSAEFGGAFNVNVVYERSNYSLADKSICGIVRARELALRQETTSDLRWENEYLDNATIADQGAKTKTTYSTVPVDNVDEVKIELVLSGRHNKVDYYLIEAYGASFVTGGDRSTTNRGRTGTAHLVDNYNYNTDDNDTDRIYYRAEYVDTDGDGVVNDDRSGSYGFVLFGTINNLTQKAVEKVNGELSDADFDNYVSMENFVDMNLRIDNGQVGYAQWVTVQNAWKAAVSAATQLHNAGDDRCWNVEHDCVEFTYHQIQHYVSDFVANGSATLRDPAVAESQTITWCNLHEECAAARTGKPNSLVKMVRAALAGEKDKLILLTVDEAEAMAHLRSNDRGTAFGSISALADALIEAVQGINAIKPWPGTINDVSEDDWDAIQGWILSDPKPADMTGLNAAMKLSKDTAWWNEGESAPGAGSLQDLLAATQKALDTDRDAWINYYRYETAFTDMKDNGVSPTAQWTRITENLVQDMDGNAFDDYDQFRTAIKAAVAAMGTDRTWNEYQYYIIHNADPNTDPDAAAEYPSYWWHNGYSRVTDLPSLLTAAQMYLDGDTVVWDMFTITDLYDLALPQLHFREGFNGTTDKYTNIDNFKAAVLNFIKEPGASIVTGNSDANAKSDAWNQLQYYLLHPGCDLTDFNTVLAYQSEAVYYWWKDAGEGTAYSFTAGSSDNNIARLMEAVYRAAINGNPHALDNLTESAAAASRLIPVYNGTEENWSDLTKYDSATLDDLKTKLVALAQAAGADNCRALNWRQIQHYLLTDTYLLATDPNLPTDSATDKDGAVRNYWWRLGDINPNLATDIKTDLDTFLEIIDTYNAGGMTQAEFNTEVNTYSGITGGAGSRLNLYAGTPGNMKPIATGLNTLQKNTYRTKMRNIAAYIKSQGVAASDVLDWFVLQYYALSSNSYSSGSPLVTKEVAQNYYVNTLLGGDLTQNWAPSYVTITVTPATLEAASISVTDSLGALVETDPETGLVTTISPDIITKLPGDFMQLQRTITVLSPEGKILKVTTIIEIYDADYNLISSQTITMQVPEEPVCTCGSEDGVHAEDCPLYVAPEEPVCACGSENGCHAEDCPLYEAPAETEPPTETGEPTESPVPTHPAETPEPEDSPDVSVSPEPEESQLPETSESPIPPETEEPAVTETPEGEPDAPIDPPETTQPTPSPEPEYTLETMPEVVDPELEEMGDEPIEEADASVGSSETEELDSGAGVPTGLSEIETIVVETMPPLGGPEILRNHLGATDYKRLTTKIDETKLRVRAGGVRMKQRKIKRIISPPGRLSVPLLLRTEPMERRSAV